MNAIHNEAYGSVKYHLQETIDLYPAYIAEKTKSLEMSHIKIYSEYWLANTDGRRYPKKYPAAAKVRSDDTKRLDDEKRSTDTKPSDRTNDSQRLLSTKISSRTRSGARVAREKFSMTNEDESEKDAGWTAMDGKDDAKDCYMAAGLNETADRASWKGDPILHGYRPQRHFNRATGRNRDDNTVFLAIDGKKDTTSSEDCWMAVACEDEIVNRVSQWIGDPVRMTANEGEVTAGLKDDYKAIDCKVVIDQAVEADGEDTWITTMDVKDATGHEIVWPPKAATDLMIEYRADDSSTRLPRGA
ncbi:hypothetical protein MMC07_003416 [Pseudocyphellaria aurata]|nr:hypothetical protein [Pseudocyphellaria aurata]